MKHPPSRCVRAALAAAALLIGSGAAAPSRKPPAKRPAAAPDAGCPVRFTDVATSSGLRFAHERGGTADHQLPETMGSGVAWLDYDGDGRLDLYVVQSGLFPPKGEPGSNDRLYRNRGDGTFEDVTEKARIRDRAYGMGAIAADYDNDGRVDVLVTNYGRNILWRNRGDGTFEDVTEKAGIAGSGWPTSAAWADFDADGDLDLFVVRYVEYSIEKNFYCGDPQRGIRQYCHPSVYSPDHNQLFRNEGNGSFTEVTESSGIAAAKGKGLGVVVSDLDGDGRPDAYIANDTTMNFLFRNLGGGRFEDVSLLSGAGINPEARPLGGMGVNAGDLDGDGLPDLVVTNFEAEMNSFYRNLGDGVFEDLSSPSGFGGPSFLFSGFGLNLFDADNDGDLDAFIANGHVSERPKMAGVTYAERPFLMWNQGKGKFIERGCGPPFRRELVGRGSAAADYDNDGDVDVAVSNSGGPLQLLRNGGKPSRWVGFALKGRRSNKEGIGARVMLETELSKQVREARAGDSYLSSSDPRVHFGLGSARTIRRVEIRWPSGTVQELRDIEAGRYHSVEEPSGNAGASQGD